MKFNNKMFFLLMLCCFISLKLMAQSGPGDSPGDPDVPLDGGLSIALAAGIGYGARKLLKKKDSNNPDREKDITKN